MSLKERLRLEEMETASLLGGSRLPSKALVGEEEINETVICEEENTTKQ